MYARRGAAVLAIAVPSAVLASGCGPADAFEPEAVFMDPEIAQTTVQRHDGPFGASLEGVATFAPRVEGRCRTMDVPFITLTTGTGTATHLGRFETSASHCFEAGGGEPPPYGVFERGEWTFTAANGDELHARYQGEQLTPVLADPTLVTAEVVFDGGTGRFRDATGSAHAEGRITVPDDWETEPWPVRFTIEGRINY